MAFSEASKNGAKEAVKKATAHRRKNDSGKGVTGAVPDRISEKMTCISHGTAAKA